MTIILQWGYLHADLKLNGEVVAQGVQFASTDVTLATSELRLHLFNFDAGTVWWDDVAVRYDTYA